MNAFKPRMSGRTVLLMVLVSLLVSGCGTRAYPVQGQMVFEDGAPAKELAGYLIMFQSEEAKVSASGVIQPDGTFTVGTFKQDDGAVRGKQRVAITQPPAEVHKVRPPLCIPTRYGTFDTSQLEVDIKPETNTLTIKVERLKR